MKVNIRRLNDGTLFESVNEQGVRLWMDGSPDVGGLDAGFRPMQLLLSAIGGCSSIDVIDILRKQKQNLTGMEVEVSGHRETGAIPAVFTQIHVHFKIQGMVEEEKLQRALELSFTKYCSVAKMLESTAKITYDYQLNS